MRVEREIAKHYLLLQPGTNLIYFDQTSRCFRFLSEEIARLVIGDTEVPTQGKPFDPERDSLPPTLFGDTLAYGGEVDFRADDVILSAGLVWDNDFMGHLFSLRAELGFSLVQVVHDVIPTIMPEYCVPEMEFRFPRFVLDVACTADLVLCVSDNTKRDFTNYLEKLDISVPPSAVIRLGNTLIRSSSAKRPYVDGKDLQTGRYILYVSTIEPRKNHQMLFNIWREIADHYGDELPTLVLVGRVGWNMDDLINYIRAAPNLFPGRIKLLHDVTDDELAWLYGNARFTVYPSLYEGWGLPVVESLAMGKPCIASDCSSIPEAAAGFAELIDPLDHVSWRRSIMSLIDDDFVLAERSRAIETGFKPASWDECMRDLRSVVSRHLNADRA